MPRPPFPYAMLFPLVLAACGDLKGPTAFEPITDPAALYMTLTLDHRAINLSTAPSLNTIQLTATPRNAFGDAMTGLPAVTFRSSDTASVRVTPQGLIEARQAGTGIRVSAELTADGNIRHADTVLVNVTADPAPPALATFSLDPVPPDSAVFWLLPRLRILDGIFFVSGIKYLPTIDARALDDAGNAIPGLQINYRSLDLLVANFDPNQIGFLRVQRPGQARLVASTHAYGVTRADTVTYTVKPPFYQGIILGVTGPGAIVPSEVLVQPNGFVAWVNQSGQPAEVTFDDPTNVAEATLVCEAARQSPFFSGSGYALCGAGNIVIEDSSGPLVSRVRQFRVPGVYTYRNTRTGATGRIVVSNDLPPS